MTLPNIDDIIPEGPWRKRVYQALAVLGVLLFLTQTAYAAMPSVPQPLWLTVALAVYAPLAAGGFLKAQANTPLEPFAPIRTATPAAPVTPVTPIQPVTPVTPAHPEASGLPLGE